MSDYDEDRTINQLDPAGVMQNTDEFVIAQGQGTYRATASQVGQYIAQGVPNPPSLPPFQTAHRTTNWAFAGTTHKVPMQAAFGTVGNIWNIAQPTRMTVPVGTTYVRVSGNLRLASDSSTFETQLWISKNNTTFPGYPTAADHKTNTGTNRIILNVSSGPLPVIAGDYFELNFYSSGGNGSPLDVPNAEWISIELLN